MNLKRALQEAYKCYWYCSIFLEPDDIPGPGAYNPSREITESQKPAYSLGRRLEHVSDSKLCNFPLLKFALVNKEYIQHRYHWW